MRHACAPPPLAHVRTAPVEPPVPAREDDDVRRPEHGGGPEQVRCGNGMPHEPGEQHDDAVEQSEREQAQHAIARLRIDMMKPDVARNERNHEERDDEYDEHARRPESEVDGKGEVQARRREYRNRRRPARLRPFYVVRAQHRVVIGAPGRKSGATVPFVALIRPVAAVRSRHEDDTGEVLRVLVAELHG